VGVAAGVSGGRGWVVKYGVCSKVVTFEDRLICQEAGASTYGVKESSCFQSGLGGNYSPLENFRG